MDAKIIQQRLKNFGINDAKDLQKLTGTKSLRICQMIWYGHREISLKMAKTIKQKTGASLDYIL